MAVNNHGGKRPGAGRKPGPTSDHALDFAKARARKEKALADLREMESKKMSGDLLPIEEVRSAWLSAVSTAKGRLLALPSRLAPEVILISDVRKAENLIKTQIMEILQELTQGDDAGD